MINEILNQREQTHGNFHQGATYFNELMNVVNNGKANLDSSQYYALSMIMAKVTRILNGNAHEADHWQDIIGYATLGGRLAFTTPTIQPLVDTLPILDLSKHVHNHN